jgi:hypothetical protein
MTNNNIATSRPTAAQIQAETARQDRRAAAKARRADKVAGIESVTEQNARLYSNIGN